jgi:hypothetical protein
MTGQNPENRSHDFEKHDAAKSRSMPLSSLFAN